MSIMELGALGEFVGSFLVLATLIYLVIQVHQTRRGINSSNFVNATHMFNHTNIAMVSDVELIDLWIRGCNEPETLGEVEAARYQLLLRAINNNFFALHGAYQEGSFPEQKWKVYERNFGELLATRGGISLIRSFEFAAPDFAVQMRQWRDAVGGETRWTREGFQLVGETP